MSTNHRQNKHYLFTKQRMMRILYKRLYLSTLQSRRLVKELDVFMRTNEECEEHFGKTTHVIKITQKHYRSTRKR